MAISAAGKAAPACFLTCVLIPRARARFRAVAAACFTETLGRSAGPPGMGVTPRAGRAGSINIKPAGGRRRLPLPFAFLTLQPGPNPAILFPPLPSGSPGSIARGGIAGQPGNGFLWRRPCPNSYAWGKRHTTATRCRLLSFELSNALVYGWSFNPGPHGSPF